MNNNVLLVALTRPDCRIGFHHLWRYETIEEVATTYTHVLVNSDDGSIEISADTGEAEDLEPRAAEFVCTLCDKRLNADDNGMLIEWM